jgi:hypothetical protein
LSSTYSEIAVEGDLSTVVGCIRGRLWAGNASFPWPAFFGVEVVSIAFMLGTPFAIGSIVIYGLRDTKPSIAKMIFAPWLSILLALIGSAIALLEGTVCIVLASPLFSLHRASGA